MSSYAQTFVPPTIATNEVLTAGAQLFVASLASATSPRPLEPVVITFTADAAAASEDTSISLTHNQASTAVIVRQGMVLYFGAVKAVITAETSIASGSSATSVPVEALSASIAEDATATSWNLLRVLSPSDIPNTSTDTMVDRKDLTFGLQGSQVKVGTTFEPQVTVIRNPNERALDQIIYPASNGAQSIFAHIVYPGGLHVWGSTKVSNFTLPNAINEIQRPQFTLNFQAPYARPTIFAFLSTAEKAVFNTVMQLSGLNTYS